MKKVDKKFWERNVVDSSIPQGQPEDISSAVLFAASDEAKFMTGAVLVIDGGVSCN